MSAAPAAQQGGRAVEAVASLIRHALAEGGGRLLVVGVSGAQGSGKSTLASALKKRFDRENVAAALLSIDDLYLTRTEREVLAKTVHPLLATRGTPGTHDAPLGLDILSRLEKGEATLLPRFDKAADDRLPQSSWDRAVPGTRLVILEGWCVGARPQAEEALAAPVNALERDEDPDCVWRRFVNRALAGDYQALFGRLDRQVFLAAPSFDVVLRWRGQQERELGARTAGSGAGVMSGAQLLRFIQHYERLTRHMLAEMPTRADMVIALDEERRAREIVERISPSGA